MTLGEKFKEEVIDPEDIYYTHICDAYPLDVRVAVMKIRHAPIRLMEDIIFQADTYCMCIEGAMDEHNG